MSIKSINNSFCTYNKFKKSKLLISLDKIKILYVVKHTLDIAKSGYTVRTNKVVQSFDNVAVILNPFFSQNKKYLNNSIKKDKGIINLYLTPSKIAELINNNNIKKIIIASNGENFLKFYQGMESLIPHFSKIHFTYEMRGLWFLSGLANAELANTINMKLNYLLKEINKERKSLELCHSVAFITPQLKDYVIKNFYSTTKFSKPNIIVPNGYDSLDSPITPKNNPQGEFTIGYFGSITGYEGIDFLIQVCKTLIEDKGLNIKLKLIGKISSNSCPESLTKKGGLLEEKFIFYKDWIEEKELNNEFKDLNLFCIPRFPFTVCDVVSPLKPFKPLYHKVPLLMSDCDSLKDISKNGKNCMLFKKGNLKDLEKKLYDIITKGYSPQLLENGYNYIINERDWKLIQNNYKNFIQ